MDESTFTPLRVGDTLLAWSAPHFGWTPGSNWPQAVASAALDAAGAPLVLIDPIAPSAAAGDAFWRWLDERRAARGGLAVLISNRFHGRHAPEVLARFPGTRVYAPEPVHGLVNVPVSDLIAAGAVLPGGIVAHGMDGMEPEVAWHVPSARALFFADAVHGTGRGLAMAPPSWCDSPEIHATRLVPAVRKLRGLEAEHVIPSHGAFEPGDGVRKLRAAVG